MKGGQGGPTESGRLLSAERPTERGDVLLFVEVAEAIEMAGMIAGQWVRQRDVLSTEGGGGVRGSRARVGGRAWRANGRWRGWRSEGPPRCPNGTTLPALESTGVVLKIPRWPSPAGGALKQARMTGGRMKAAEVTA